MAHGRQSRGEALNFRVRVRVGATFMSSKGSALMWLGRMYSTSSRTSRTGLLHGVLH